MDLVWVPVIIIGSMIIGLLAYGFIEFGGVREHFSQTKKQRSLQTEIKGVITLCGSTRFYKLFDEINYKLTMNGWIVLSIGCHSQSDYCLGIEQIQNAKEMLDKLHKKKIWMSWGVVILDKGGYIGDSTRSELEYAKANNKKIFYYGDDSYLELLS